MKWYIFFCHAVIVPLRRTDKLNFFCHAVIVPLRRTDKLNSLVFGLPVTSCALLLQHVEGGTDTSDESADEDVMVCMIVYIIR